MWAAGISVLVVSISYLYSLFLGAALGPIDSAWLIGPFAGCFVGAGFIFYAYHKTSFTRKWIQLIVLLFCVLPISTFGIFSGFQVGYIAASPLFEKVVIIERGVVLERGWHFVNSDSYFPLSEINLHECTKKLGTNRISALLEVTMHYGNVSYFRVLKFGACEVQYPVNNPNTITPAYIPGEEIVNHT